jgi:hypothetical protein
VKDENDSVTPIVALRKWTRDIGISETTAWRWAKAGLIHPINIYGKLYLTKEDIKRFAARAQAGEFSKAPGGVCKRDFQQMSAHCNEQHA